MKKFACTMILLFGMLCFGQMTSADTIEPIEYGDGVYFFNGAGERFGKALATFIKSHPELELVSMASMSDGKLYSNTDGYFVVFRKK
ncbi:MAG: hypothetical protein ACD_11C00022G0002 [uncultured bacterium]|nr:MAG: hypothetical protein ACD_11C00022G0002 [uncultured bacterium]HBR72022.1 hypothetical protein [Candidatus Moranbacteria bacterium]